MKNPSNVSSTPANLGLKQEFSEPATEYKCAVKVQMPNIDTPRKQMFESFSINDKNTTLETRYVNSRASPTSFHD